MRRNPVDPQRPTAANQARTLKRIAEYQGKADLLAAWDNESPDVQAANRAYIMELRNRVRVVRNYLLHRSDAAIDATIHI